MYLVFTIANNFLVIIMQFSFYQSLVSYEVETNILRCWSLSNFVSYTFRNIFYDLNGFLPIKVTDNGFLVCVTHRRFNPSNITIYTAWYFVLRVNKLNLQNVLIFFTCNNFLVISNQLRFNQFQVM